MQAWPICFPWPGVQNLRGDLSNASHFLQEDRYSSLSSGIRLRLGWVMPLRCSACTFRNRSSRFVFVCGCNVTPPSSTYNGKIIVLKILLVCVVPFSLGSLGEFYLLLRSFLWETPDHPDGPDGHHTLAISFAAFRGHHGTVVTPALQENWMAENGRKKGTPAGFWGGQVETFATVLQLGVDAINL